MADWANTGNILAVVLAIHHSPRQVPRYRPLYSCFRERLLPTTSQFEFTPPSPSESFYPSQPAPFKRPVVPDGSTASSNEVLRSPFRDCIGTFGLQKSLFFSLPSDGKVNGYIKFSWPKDKRAKNTLTSRTASISDANRVIEINDATDTSDGFASQSSMALTGPSRAPSRSEDSAKFTVEVSSFYSQLSAGNTTSNTPVGFTSSTVLSNASTEVVSMGAPKLLPSQYGLEAKMDNTDRRFWMFYVWNWCPGRSILVDTNLWLKDFAQMHKSLGVRSAIQSLAGIYIYDYLPLDSIRDRVNQRFFDAEERYSQLLNDPATDRDEAQANELITIAVILSMQDIVLTERRLNKPFSPRWLRGFRQGEQLLEATDHGSRFWKASNVQSSSLRVSQSIIVGRAVILAQPMSSLPPPHEFNAQEEASRFGWLLHGTDKDMYKIHGGCGFSKKLLHIMGQITYCAARLQQEPLTPIVPVTAKYLYAELREMRQWSSESRSWENAKSKPPMIKWIRSRPKGYQIDTNASMTDVTAEAWRFAAILYLQCRVFRGDRDIELWDFGEVISQLGEGDGDSGLDGLGIACECDSEDECKYDLLDDDEESEHSCTGSDADYYELNGERTDRKKRVTRRKGTPAGTEKFQARA
ncbi:zinc finger-like protein [Pochonia chlamydosporia 170]|uniref:Zinc finger-like protein n=1 Tax=Pochonia chlamydosporia 170 TaxID=1380566 RepID=A0A179EXT1_METCM|nr:zinc finger-like protein [Pochonia chlamydosporia 170]OAQ57996.1 zinc finger-like protein [Pochonia chlamydosporia 170]